MQQLRNPTIDIGGLDEGGFVDRKEFDKVLPQIRRNGSFLMIISSPPVDKNHWTLMLAKGAIPDAPLKYIPFDNICTACQQLTIKQMLQCTHQVGSLPSPN